MMTMNMITISAPTVSSFTPIRLHTTALITANAMFAPEMMPISFLLPYSITAADTGKMRMVLLKVPALMVINVNAT